MDWPLATVFTYLVVHHFIDTHYLLRSLICFIFSLFRRSPKSFSQPSCIYGICIPSDFGLVPTHMNNARVLRELDFARLDFLLRRKKWTTFIMKGGNCAVAGVFMRFRLPIAPLSLYKVVTKLVGWENDCLYFEHKLITLRDGIIRVVAFTKIATVISVADYIKEYWPNEPIRPTLLFSNDLQLWIRAMEANKVGLKASKLCNARPK